MTVVGTFHGAVELFTSDVLLCDESDARALLGLAPTEATDIAVDLSNGLERRVVAKTILRTLPQARVIDREPLLRVYALAYGRRAGLILAAAIPALLALFVFAWDRASGLSPEDRREVAIVKSVGWSTRHVLVAKLLESATVSGFATLCGMVLAYLWVFPLGAPGLRPTLVGWSVLFPKEPLTPSVDLAQILAILLAVTVPYASLSIVPAWRAASADPMEALRG
jgi:ABC-type lipoprotein release transport system permease subunit